MGFGWFDQGTGLRTLGAMRWPGLAVIVMLFASGCAVPQPRGDGQLTRRKAPESGRPYWLYLPAGYDEGARQEQRYPLVVSFHGMKPFDTAKAQAREWQQEADRYGYIVVAPELKSQDLLMEFPVRRVHRAFKADEEAVLDILDDVMAGTRADPAHVLSTSWSSGGYTAHYMLNRHPRRFSCLAVRQSNFSRGVMAETRVGESRGHPILIANTQNDLGVCRKESAQALQWYKGHGYQRVEWVRMKSLGHERTPDVAARFFAAAIGSKPSGAQPPPQRVALAGSPMGVFSATGLHPKPPERSRAHLVFAKGARP